MVEFPVISKLKQLLRSKRYRYALFCVIGFGIGLWAFYEGYLSPSFLSQSTKALQRQSSILGQYFDKERQAKAFLPELPTVRGKLPSGRGIPHQWTGDKGLFVLVLEDHTRYYKKPASDSTVLGSFSITQRVRPIFIKSQSVEDVENDERWVLVMDEFGKRPLGWVLNRELAYQNQFKLLDDWTLGDFSYQKGEFSGEYDITKKGRAMVDWESSGGGLYLKGQYVVQLYVFQDIIWAKKEKPDIWEEFFYFDSEGNFYLERRFSSDKLYIDLSNNKELKK